MCSLLVIDDQDKKSTKSPSKVVKCRKRIFDAGSPPAPAMRPCKKGRQQPVLATRKASVSFEDASPMPAVTQRGAKKVPKEAAVKKNPRGVFVRKNSRALVMDKKRQLKKTKNGPVVRKLDLVAREEEVSLPCVGRRRSLDDGLPEQPTKTLVPAGETNPELGERRVTRRMSNDMDDSVKRPGIRSRRNGSQVETRTRALANHSVQEHRKAKGRLRKPSEENTEVDENGEALNSRNIFDEMAAVKDKSPDKTSQEGVGGPKSEVAETERNGVNFADSFKQFKRRMSDSKDPPVKNDQVVVREDATSSSRRNGKRRTSAEQAVVATSPKTNSVMRGSNGLRKPPVLPPTQRRMTRRSSENCHVTSPAASSPAEKSPERHFDLRSKRPRLSDGVGMNSRSTRRHSRLTSETKLPQDSDDVQHGDGSDGGDVQEVSTRQTRSRTAQRKSLEPPGETDQKQPDPEKTVLYPEVAGDAVGTAGSTEMEEVVEVESDEETIVLGPASPDRMEQLVDIMDGSDEDAPCLGEPESQQPPSLDKV